jgi:hypothetical protein
MAERAGRNELSSFTMFGFTLIQPPMTSFTVVEPTEIVH